MKLTNYIRDAFVEAAIQDVPTVDYQEKIRVAAQADVVANLPATVRAVYEDLKTRPYIETAWYAEGETAKKVRGSFPSLRSEYAKLSAKTDKAVKLMQDQQKQQEDKVASLRSKLRAAAYACTTRKALAEMLPEFVRYLPAEADPSPRSLPVVANIVADFAAAGWPKDGKKSKGTK